MRMFLALLPALLAGCSAGTGGGGQGARRDSSTPGPTVLVTRDPAQLAGASLALDSTFLYFSTTSMVERIALAGGTPSTVASGMHGPIAVDASHVYGFDATGIVSAPKSGGTPTLLQKTIGTHFAVDSTHVYFHDYYGVRVNGDNYYQSIFSTELATGTVLNLATQQFVTGPFVSDDTHLYWFSDNQPNGEIRLMSLAKSGGPATILTHGGGATPDGPAFDGKDVYWTTYGGWTTPVPPSTLQALPAIGGTPSLLASPSGPGDLAVDASNVYFADSDDAIMKVPKGGGTPTVLVGQLNRPFGIVLSDSNVYWINQGDGTIATIPK
jgi:hypothetical protein